MHIFTKATGTAIAAIGMLALAAPAGAQRSGPPAPNNGAPLWGPGVPPVRGVPLLTADLGTGSPSGFTAVVDEANGELCYMLSTPGLMDTTAAHIHLGGPGETGNPVVALANPVGGSAGACVTVQADVARSMVANPNGYYVNVHTKGAPNGEVRGQLVGAKT